MIYGVGTRVVVMVSRLSRPMVFLTLCLMSVLLYLIWRLLHSNLFGRVEFRLRGGIGPAFVFALSFYGKNLVCGFEMIVKATVFPQKSPTLHLLFHRFTLHEVALSANKAKPGTKY
ncbi:hypothetical protein P8452_07161 [Trifolium repens]|nr:hypothetical protein P8452_07161 [Trifolium repens]